MGSKRKRKQPASTSPKQSPSASPKQQPDAATGSRAVLLVFYSLAFFSGVAALIYEITWARMLGLTFGSTTLSAAAVIAGFMGGMGLGAWLYHVIYDRATRPLVIYGGLELGIAVTTALLTRLFYHLPALFADASSVIPAGPWLAVIRFMWVFVLLVIPAMLMGATFPALCTVMIRTVQGVDRHMGKIYGINTIGAAAGALVGGLILIEWVGLTWTVTVANAINVLVGACALLLLRTPLARGDVRALPPSEAAMPTFLPRHVTSLVLFVSGFATLSYEIIWFRALRFIVGNSTYALTIVLVIFLVGLGLGALLLERVARRRTPERDLALCQCAVAVLAMLSVAGQALVVAVPALREHLCIFSATVRYSSWVWRLCLDGLLAAVTMLPATLFMGLSFPLASRLFLGDVRKLGARIGVAYLLANLGSISGALLAAVLLLPLFSTIGGTKVVAGVNLLLAAAVVLAIRRRTTGWRWPAVAAVVVVVVLSVVLPGSFSQVGQKSRLTDGTVVYRRDGDLATVEVLDDPSDSAKKTMYLDGCAIGWSEGHRLSTFYQKQVMLAHLPMALDTRIRDTLNVGLGSAATLYTLASYPDVEILDCVEISGAVASAAELFPEAAVLDDPRVTLVIDDAVHFLLQAGRYYDLIISDGKQDPFFSGNAPLLSREFYLYAMNRLTENGIFTQWFPMGTLHVDFRVSLRTLCEVFPHVEVFWFPPYSVIMLAAPRPIFGRPQLSRELFDSLRTGSDLKPYMIDHPSALLAWWAAGKPQFQRVLGRGPVSTWDHLLLDFTAFKATYEDWSRAYADNTALLLDAERVPRPPVELFELWQPAYRESSALVRRAYGHLFVGNYSLAQELSEQAVKVNPDDRAARAAADTVRREAARLRDGGP